jgi:hypothetical protein
MTAIVQLIRYQDKKTFYMFCDRCQTQFKQDLPLSMRLSQVICPHCQTDGFIIGHAARDNK